MQDGENASAEENTEDVEAPSSSRKASRKSQSQDETDGKSSLNNFSEKMFLKGH